MTSAVALIGLCSLAAVETGGCSNSSKSLASVTRTGLPLLYSVLRGPLAQLSLTKFSRAVTANNPEVENHGVETFVEHGLGPMSELAPHCGRYEFKDNGKVVAWDALVSDQSPEQLKSTLSKRDRNLNWSNPTNGVWFAERTVLGKPQHIQVHAVGVAKLPPNCRELGKTVHSVVIVAETL
jgi:hypothetical protein